MSKAATKKPTSSSSLYDHLPLPPRVSKRGSRLDKRNEMKKQNYYTYLLSTLPQTLFYNREKHIPHVSHPESGNYIDSCDYQFVPQEFKDLISPEEIATYSGKMCTSISNEPLDFPEFPDAVNGKYPAIDMFNDYKITTSISEGNCRKFIWAIKDNIIRYFPAEYNDGKYKSCIFNLLKQKLGHDPEYYLQNYDRIMHSCLFKSLHVNSAGEMCIDLEGNIIYINNISGHYKPYKSSLKHALYKLRNQGYDITIHTLYDLEGMWTHFPETLVEALGIKTKNKTRKQRKTRKQIRKEDKVRTERIESKAKTKTKQRHKKRHHSRK